MRGDFSIVARVLQKEDAAGVSGGTHPIEETGEPENSRGRENSTVRAPSQGPRRQGHTEVMASVCIPSLTDIHCKNIL